MSFISKLESDFLMIEEEGLDSSRSAERSTRPISSNRRLIVSCRISLEQIISQIISGTDWQTSWSKKVLMFLLLRKIFRKKTMANPAKRDVVVMERLGDS